MSGDQPDNRDAEQAFGGDAPPSGADAFGQGAFQPPATPHPGDPEERHGGFAPPVAPIGEPIAPPPPPPAQPPPASTWPPVRHEPTTQGHASTWPPPDPGRQLRNADGATASLVLGIISWVICPVICSIPAIVLARQARAEIDASPTPLGGRDNASAGFWLGVSSLIVYGLFIVYLIVDAAARGS
jgi:hypothetical protein